MVEVAQVFSGEFASEEWAQQMSTEIKRNLILIKYAHVGESADFNMHIKATQCQAWWI
jgi:hypothetical protein